MKVYETEYVLVEGHKEVFEKEMNERSKDGFVYCGNHTVFMMDSIPVYSVIMSKVKEKSVCNGS